MPADDDDPLRIGGIARPTGAAAASATEGAEGVGAAEAVHTEATLGVGSVAEALGTGAIDGEAAVRALALRAATAMLGPGADPATVAAVRAEVEALLAGDPTLASLLRT